MSFAILVLFTRGNHDSTSLVGSKDALELTSPTVPIESICLRSIEK